jgi:ABC-2 type transport system ATP-binding protein
MFCLVIRTENLSKLYGRRTGVQNLTLEVEPGEVYGFLGTPGAGKTTTIRMLLDFIRPSYGRALLLGKDVRKHTLEVRRHVGFLPEKYAFGAHKTGESYLRHITKLRGDVSWSYARALSERFGIDLSRQSASYTAADRQKLGLVQAFMHRPELLILDEPARSLDTETQNALFQLITEVRREGRSIFYATQSLQEVERICDRVGIMHNGQLVAVERTVRLRGRALRKVEMRFANPVPVDAFSGLTNVENVRFEDNLLSCTVRGELDALIKLASQYRVTDFICQQPALEEVFRRNYGVNAFSA